MARYTRGMVALGFTALLVLLVALLIRLIAAAPLLATLVTCFDNEASNRRPQGAPPA